MCNQSIISRLAGTDQASRETNETDLASCSHRDVSAFNIGEMTLSWASSDMLVVDPTNLAAENGGMTCQRLWKLAVREYLIRGHITKTHVSPKVLGSLATGQVSGPQWNGNLD